RRRREPQPGRDAVVSRTARGGGVPQWVDGGGPIVASTPAGAPGSRLRRVHVRTDQFASARLAAARRGRTPRRRDRPALPSALKSRCYAVPRMVGSAFRSPATTLAVVLATLITIPLADSLYRVPIQV